MEVTLPAGAQVWSAFVGGQPVRTSQRGGKVLLPMERSGGDATVPVELIYVSDCKFPGSSGLVKLASPALDVPLKNARWDFYLPPDYRYEEFEGSMRRDLGAATVATVTKAAQSVQSSVYSMRDYEVAEAGNRKETGEGGGGVVEQRAAAVESWQFE